MVIFNSNQSYVIHEKNNSIQIIKNNCQKSYSILEKDGNLNNNYFCVMNHLYVNSNRQNDFKDKFLNRFKRLNTVTGYKALRFLEPHNENEHYIILTLWLDRQDFYNWQLSNQYKATHLNRGTNKGVDQHIVNRNLSYNIRFELANN